MVTRALVLGGGGPVGVGWEAGIVAGLEEDGVRLADADLIVGTSAGAIVGSQLALGRPASELLAVQLAVSDSGRSSLQRMQRLFDASVLVQNMRQSVTSGMSLEERLRQIGAFALSAETMSEDEWLETFGTMQGLGTKAWPEQRLVCTAVDAEEGRVVAWDRDSGVPLNLAVASSGAVPGIFPPVTIDGHRYMDGGMRSLTNADLARGYDIVVIVAPIGTGAGGPATPERARMAEIARRRFEDEIAPLREDGSTIELIAPDEASLEAFGPNVLDPTRRRAAAEAGHRQGKAEAPRLRDLWELNTPA